MVDGILRFPNLVVNSGSNLDIYKFSFSVHRERRFNYLTAVKAKDLDFIFSDQSWDEIPDNKKYVNIPKMNPRFYPKRKLRKDNMYTRVDPYIYADGKYNFVLWYDTDPLCFVSFDIIEKEAVIHSLQGIGKLDNGKLSHFDWKRTLIDVVEDYARLRSLESVSIIKGKDNLWYQNFESRAESMYDDTALSLGYWGTRMVRLKAKRLSERQSREVEVLVKRIEYT